MWEGQQQQQQVPAWQASQPSPAPPEAGLPELSPAQMALLTQQLDAVCCSVWRGTCSDKHGVFVYVELAPCVPC